MRSDRFILMILHVMIIYQLKKILIGLYTKKKGGGGGGAPHASYYYVL